MFRTAKTHTHSRIKNKEKTLDAFGLPLTDLYEKNVVCLKSDHTVWDAANLMLENHIGDIVVTESHNGKTVPVGIVTDRDIVISSVAKKLAPETLKLYEIITKKMVTATEGSNLSDLVQLLTDEGISRLPIVDSDGALKGILTSKRLFQYFAEGICELSSLSNQQQRREEKAH
jgi:CBS domain-containing protein